MYEAEVLVCRRDIYYSYHEVLYALCERRAGRSMPTGSDELDALRVRAQCAAVL